MSNLIVVTFDQEETAGRAMRDVRAIEGGGGFGLADTATVVKDRAGELRVDNEWSSGAEQGAVAGGIVGGVVTFLFPPIGAAIGAGLGALVGSRLGTGVDQGFVDGVGAALGPGTSAVFLVLKDGADLAAVVAAFRPFEGTVHQTTLTPDFEDSLRRALSDGQG